jgi:methylated-DNA-[protein]-cysteine S-methyltransferase
VIESPIGDIGVATDGGALIGVSFGRPKAMVGPAPPVAGADAALVDQARWELSDYFAGGRVDFDLPRVIIGGSEFERAVWAQIAAIPYGETNSYGAIARAVGEPGGAQAVGMACNRNPLPIIVPCHRVIGSDGKLVGFGGGLSRKRFLLALEARVHIEHTLAP